MSFLTLDERLDVAMNNSELPGYLAAARYHWPMDLLELKAAQEMVEKLSGELLRFMKQLELADDLAYRVHDYLKQYVNHGPAACDGQAGAMIKSVELYREMRGIEP